MLLAAYEDEDRGPSWVKGPEADQRKESGTLTFIGGCADANTARPGYAKH